MFLCCEWYPTKTNYGLNYQFFCFFDAIKNFHLFYELVFQTRSRNDLVKVQVFYHYWLFIFGENQSTVTGIVFSCLYFWRNLGPKTKMELISSYILFYYNSFLKITYDLLEEVEAALIQLVFGLCSLRTKMICIVCNFRIALRTLIYRSYYHLDTSRRLCSPTSRDYSETIRKSD